MMVVTAFMAADGIKVPVMTAFHQPVLMMAVMMSRHHDHFAIMMAPMVVMSMAGFDHDGLGAGGTRQKQYRNPGKQKLLH
jgi:hypothetical protein